MHVYLFMCVCLYVYVFLILVIFEGMLVLRPSVSLPRLSSYGWMGMAKKVLSVISSMFTYVSSSVCLCVYVLMLMWLRSSMREKKYSQRFFSVLNLSIYTFHLHYDKAKTRNISHS